MAIVTKTLAVTKTTNSTPPRKIKFRTTPPVPVPPNLVILTLIENSGIGAINGVINSGAGTCDAQMPSALFNPIWTAVTDPTHKNFKVVITYDDTSLVVSAIQVTFDVGLAVAPPVVPAVENPSTDPG